MSSISDVFKTQKIDPGSEVNPAVLIIDMQDEFLEKIPKKQRKRIMRNQMVLISYCQKKDIPVIALEYEGPEKTQETLLNKIKQVPRNETVTKPSNNGFTSPKLYKTLWDDWKANYLIVSGINASACVKQTAAAARKKGFQVATSNDLIADPKYWRPGKSIGWYAENGKFYRNMMEMLSSGSF